MKLYFSFFTFSLHFVEQKVGRLKSILENSFEVSIKFTSDSIFKLTILKIKLRTSFRRKHLRKLKPRYTSESSTQNQKPVLCQHYIF